ncbi:hypothetical protein PIIN_09270 [Serendipita indica DSM 11827]|uniref:Uncharacterized protein n=1 Tax=Serendipita indica (strain DSM 11827) TaxID=1109443 RepID=G4TVE3_SERID|nr:hypothetical protein PIIN_09270 [Serendipita indica DSM 11827]
MIGAFMLYSAARNAQRSSRYSNGPGAVTLWHTTAPHASQYATNFLPGVALESDAVVALYKRQVAHSRETDHPEWATYDACGETGLAYSTQEYLLILGRVRREVPGKSMRHQEASRWAQRAPLRNAPRRSKVSHLANEVADRVSSAGSVPKYPLLTSFSVSYGRHVNTILRDIISRAQGLRHITFPVLEYNQPYAPHHTDSSAFNYDSPLTLKDYQWPSSLTALCLDVLPENNTDLRSPLGNISSLVVRKMVYISGDEVLNIGLGLNLRHFDCRWHFYDGEADGQAKTLTSIRNFITMLSSLESLAIGIEYSKRDKYKSFRMTPHILEEYIGIIKKLRRLHAIKIYTFQLRADDSNPTFEKSVILRLAGACPTLEQVTLEIPDTYNYKGIAFIWKRCIREKLDAGEVPLWLPDPELVERWKIWFKVYTTAELVKRQMYQLWGKERLIPSLFDLENLAYCRTPRSKTYLEARHTLAPLSKRHVLFCAY